MAPFTFSKSDRDAIAQKIQQYFVTELDQEIGQFEAAFLLKIFAEEVGPYFYNNGLQDAQALLKKRMDDIANAIDSLEKPTHGQG